MINTYLFSVERFGAFGTLLETKLPNAICGLCSEFKINDN